MTDFDLRLLNAEILVADQQRREQAYWAAYCELGPEPDYQKSPIRHKAYSLLLVRKAKEVFMRVI